MSSPSEPWFTQAGPAAERKTQTLLLDEIALATARLAEAGVDSPRADAELIRERATNPYGLGTPYIWGTAEAAAGCALTCLLYAELSGQKEYSALARRQRDFILGCNPFGVSCVIGAGKRYPRFPHHQIANIENLELTGAVVGGPTSASVYHGEDIALQVFQVSFQVLRHGFLSRIGR